jgi:hypothetical protein
MRAEAKVRMVQNDGGRGRRKNPGPLEDQGLGEPPKPARTDSLSLSAEAVDEAMRAEAKVRQAEGGKVGGAFGAMGGRGNKKPIGRLAGC